MASLETLLSSVRSDTPISFFLVVSKVAFLGLAELDLSPPAEAPARAALSFARLVIPCEDGGTLVSQSVLVGVCRYVIVVVMRRVAGRVSLELGWALPGRLGSG